MECCSSIALLQRQRARRNNIVLSPTDSLASLIEALRSECSQILRGKQGFGQRRLLLDDGEAIRVLLSYRPRPRALELE